MPRHRVLDKLRELESIFMLQANHVSPGSLGTEFGVINEPGRT